MKMILTLAAWGVSIFLFIHFNQGKKHKFKKHEELKNEMRLFDLILWFVLIMSLIYLMFLVYSYIYFFWMVWTLVFCGI